MNLGSLLGAMLALVVAMVLACRMARVACSDDDCQTLGTVLLQAMTHKRSSHQPSSVTKKDTIVGTLFDWRGQPMQRSNGESLLAISKSLSKVDAAVEDQRGSNPKLEIKRKMQQSDPEAGLESFPRHVGTEDVTLVTRVRVAPMNMTARRPLQSAAARFRDNLQRARMTGNRTLQAAVVQTRQRSSFANNVTHSSQVQATNRSRAQRTSPRPAPAAEVPDRERESYSIRGPRLPGLLPPINLAGLTSLWHHLRNNGTGLEREAPVSHTSEQVRVLVEAARHKNSWLLIVVAMAILLSIMFVWRCFFISRGSERLPGFDNLENEDYSHEAWVLQSGKRSSGNILIPPLALQPASLPHEKARSSSPVPNRNPDRTEPRSRLF